MTDFTMVFYPEESYNNRYLMPFTSDNADKVMNIIRRECSRIL